MKNNIPLVLEDDDGIRPAGKPDECFYCHAKVGEPHIETCVILNRRTKIKFTVQIVIDTPFSWSKEVIENYYNNSTWCHNNCAVEIQNYCDELEPNGCLCFMNNGFKAEVVDILSNIPHRKNIRQEVVD
jgi:hypothetical protein